MAKDTRIAFRTSEATKDRLAKAAAFVRLSETALAEACVEALVEYIEENGQITLPLAIIPKSSLPKKTDNSSPLEEHVRANPPRSIPVSNDALFVNEGPGTSRKKTGPKVRSTKPGIRKTVKGGHP